MVLREKIRHEEGLRRVASMKPLKIAMRGVPAFILPTNEEDEAVIDELMRRKMLDKAVRKLGLSKEDSERLMRIERMLVEVLKKSGL